jgi:hypothetical protein
MWTAQHGDLHPNSPKSLVPGGALEYFAYSPAAFKPSKPMTLTRKEPYPDAPKQKARCQIDIASPSVLCVAAIILVFKPVLGDTAKSDRTCCNVASLLEGIGSFFFPIFSMAPFNLAELTLQFAIDDLFQIPCYYPRITG